MKCNEIFNTEENQNTNRLAIEINGDNGEVYPAQRGAEALQQKEEMLANESDMLMADENLDLNIEEDQIQNTPNHEDSSLGMPNKITLNVAPIEPDPNNDNDTLTPLDDPTALPMFYKLATQSTISELEWTVTHSRYDFPW